MKKFTTLEFFYKGNKDQAIKTSNPYMKAILYSFAENYNKQVSLDHIVKISSDKLGADKIQEVTKELVNIGMQLFLQGYLSLTAASIKPKADTVKPKLNTMAMYQINQNNSIWITNTTHEPIRISNDLERYVFKYMDGSRDIEAIVNELQIHLSKNEITIKKDNLPITNIHDVYDVLVENIKQIIETANINNLLV